MPWLHEARFEAHPRGASSRMDSRPILAPPAPVCVMQAPIARGAPPRPRAHRAVRRAQGRSCGEDPGLFDSLPGRRRAKGDGGGSDEGGGEGGEGGEDGDGGEGQAEAGGGRVGAGWVASVTSVSTPHDGTPLVPLVHDWMPFITAVRRARTHHTTRTSECGSCPSS